MDAQGFAGRVAAEVEAVLAEALAVPEGVGRAEARLWEAMRYSALGGGKRLRPVLVVAAYEACGGTERLRALRAGAAVEMVHTYTLMQDDLPCMDNDDLRRGKPSAHREFDECTAILASDALHAEAHALVMDPRTHPDVTVRAAVLGALLAATGARGVLGGQMIDMVYEWERHVASEDELRRLQALKTGALMTASCRMGALLAGADVAALEALGRYGDALGLAFQVTDDILDVTGDAAALGKTPGKDAKAGKATFVTRMGVDGARALVRTLVAEGTAAVEPVEGKDGLLAAILRMVEMRQT